MDYKLYKLAFQGAVHFGNRNLHEGVAACCADTVFSALCQEALCLGEDQMQALCQYARDGKLLFSDAFPYMGKTCYLPKPMKRIEAADQNRGDSVIKKAYKKLKYVPADSLEAYLRGEYDVLKAQGTEGLGHFQMKVSASIRGEEETLPYRVGAYFFHPGNGLYLLVGYEGEEVLELAESLLDSLSYSGIGGKRSAGMGRFVLHSGAIPADLRKRLASEGKQYMSLSVSLPREEELEGVLRSGEYLLIRRGGFVASARYAGVQMRKRDLYVFQAGSCFETKYRGDIYDVSDGRGAHPVYRYAKPLFLEVGN